MLSRNHGDHSSREELSCRRRSFRHNRRNTSPPPPSPTLDEKRHSLRKWYLDQARLEGFSDDLHKHIHQDFKNIVDRWDGDKDKGAPIRKMVNEKKAEYIREAEQNHPAKLEKCPKPSCKASKYKVENCWKCKAKYVESLQHNSPARSA